ncbi:MULTISPECIES: winged helix-turn-helix transcriptional regulator [unclassified Nocardioides]|uniref:winged helix-turn-helix transcriptional regulator n=1 Tax=unclassified Nocardioides TaxID=2615069 RepID=UPI0007018A90|nr:MULTISPECIES: helix-turn-helix domain-containing protein [unclassified Nocardioides]KRA37579.1 HxlR family transcriptional regulator [Nocardioides sp. Root614]KRA91540.1 HxlR family transcriptional regulator [Nocardioides sp. Root682]
MPDYGNYCPVSMAAEVVADRWTPLIIRELVLGNTRFNDIARAMPGISRSLLVQRLRHLEKRGVLETWPAPTGRGSEYHLTPAGRDLERVIDSLGRWAIEWLFDEIRPHDVSPTTLMWWMHRRVDHGRLPPGRTVVEFRHTAPDPVSIWLVLDHGDVSVCLQHPGFEVDVEVTAATPALADVFQGYCSWAEAVDAGRIEVAGPPRLTRALPRWFLWSPWADVTRERADRVLNT